MAEKLTRADKLFLKLGYKKDKYTNQGITAFNETTEDFENIVVFNEDESKHYVYKKTKIGAILYNIGVNPELNEVIQLKRKELKFRKADRL